MAKRNKYDSDAGMQFLMAINPQQAMNLADKQSKKPFGSDRKSPTASQRPSMKAPPSNKRPGYPREIDKNPKR